jgi:hypothetical protein
MIRRFRAIYEGQSGDESVAEDEAGLCSLRSSRTFPANSWHRYGN